MTDDRLKQITAWYRDPVRKLPRKVKADVAALVAELERVRWHVEFLDAIKYAIPNLGELAAAAGFETHRNGDHVIIGPRRKA